jgi:signal transduction histidine kinase
MNFLEYIKERIIFILINLVILIISSILLLSLGVYTYAVIFTFILNLIGSLLFHIYDYFNKKGYYMDILNNLDSLDKKYLISDIINEPSFLDGKLLYKIIKDTNKSMNDEMAEIKKDTSEYREYIELWVHEIKTPIASCKLLVENNESEVTKSIDEEIDKVQDYIEQALFYARSNELQKDYIIKKVNIKDCVNSVIKRNANVLIKKKIKLELSNIDKVVYSDSKWLEFILHQIITNSIKYMDKKESAIKIYCEDKADNITLYICDNGIGMNEKAVKKAFEKGYTGENGRLYSKSTGIGLYLCKKLCKKLGLWIKLSSKKEYGTIVSIIFPIDKRVTFKD